MQFVVADDMPDLGPMSDHRGGGINFRRLLRGDPQAPDNFELSLIEISPDYRTPRHRHNFDQIHFILRGEHCSSPDHVLPTGSVTYFPEGCFYGPQGGKAAFQLALQLAGAGGDGFLAYDDLMRGNAELSTTGTFEAGNYSWVDDAGTRHNADGYEAIWSHVRGRAVVYPKPRYRNPVTIDPSACHYVPDPDEQGVFVKHLGTFTERGTSVRFVRVDAGHRHQLGSPRGTVVAFVVSGQLRDDERTYPAWTAFRLDRGETLALDAIEQSELYVVDLPVFDDPV